MDDKAKELYNKSKLGKKRNDNSGLSTRVYNMLQRETSGIVLEDGTVDVKAIREKIESGDVWNIRNCGMSSVMELCNYVSKNDNS
jgi:hypothetical protein